VLDRLHTVCTVSVVLDCVFVLLYMLLFLTYLRTENPTTNCYAEHGYVWHHIEGFNFGISSLVALAGVIVHSKVVCSAKVSSVAVGKVQTFANIILCWFFVFGILLCVSSLQTPEECTEGHHGHPTVVHNASNPHQLELQREHEQMIKALQKHHQEQAESHAWTLLAWHTLYILMWSSWVTACAVVGVLARRVHPGLISLESAVSTHSAVLHATLPQTIGVPVNAPNAGSYVSGVPVDQEVATGMPVAPASTSQGPTEAHPGDPPTKPPRDESASDEAW